MSNQLSSPPAFGPAVNRISDVMAHTRRYAFKGGRRLAHDVGVSGSTISRTLHRRINPSFLLVARITDALEKELGIPIDPRDLVAENGSFRTFSVCSLTHCAGCLPEAARTDEGEVSPPFQGVRRGEWMCSRHPRGWKPREVHED